MGQPVALVAIAGGWITHGFRGLAIQDLSNEMVDPVANAFTDILLDHSGCSRILAGGDCDRQPDCIGIHQRLFDATACIGKRNHGFSENRKNVFTGSPS